MSKSDSAVFLESHSVRRQLKAFTEGWKQNRPSGLALPRYIKTSKPQTWAFLLISLLLLLSNASRFFLATSSQSATFDVPFVRRNTTNILMNWQDLSGSNLGVVAWCCSEQPIQTACGAR